MIKSGFIVSWVLFATGEVIPSTTQVGNIATVATNLGALGVLSVVAYFLFRELQSQRKESIRQRDENTKIMNVLCERWNEWEKIRHEDSNKLDETLRDMTANCSAIQSSLKNRYAGKE